jgi:hypothetical protein
LATQVAKAAKADQHVDENLNDLAIRRLGYVVVPLRIPNRIITITITIPTTLHWYTTHQAEDALISTKTPNKFGRAMNSYQDSYAHWQQFGDPDTTRAIIDKNMRDGMVPLIRDFVKQQCESR